MIYDDWCYKQNCEHYIDWQFSVDGYEQPYDCTSCKLQGQSYNITEIAKDCPHKERAIIQQQVQADSASDAVISIPVTGKMVFRFGTPTPRRLT